MKIELNGKSISIKNVNTVSDLVKDRNLRPETIAIEYNGDIIKREIWGEVLLKEKDVIDIVTFMGGGNV